MTIQELLEALHSKGFQLQERLDQTDNFTISTLWAVRPLSVKQHYLGTKNAVLQEPLAHFLQSWRYQEIGRTREEIAQAFVTEWIESVDKDYVYEGNRENLYGRVLRLYDELKQADW